MFHFFGHFRVVFLLTLFCFSTNAVALPPEPATTSESEKASEATDRLFLLNYVHSDRDHPDVVQQRNKVYNYLEAGCLRNDAWACAQIANLASASSRYPDRRAARQQFAAKAASLYIQFCEARLDTSDCTDMHEFLKKVAEEDKKEPSYATDGLLPYALRLARAMAQACAIPTIVETSANLTDDQFDAALEAESKAGKGYSGRNCGDGLELLEKYSPAEAKPVREAMCARGLNGACAALGRLSQEQTVEEAKLANECEAGNGASCMSLASKWAYRKNFPSYGAEARKWAQKSCGLNFAVGCAVYGQFLITSEYGSLNYSAAADAFGKACKAMPKGQAEQMCKSEKAIRDALAAQKAKAVAAPLN